MPDQTRRNTLIGLSVTTGTLTTVFWDSKPIATILAVLSSVAAKVPKGSLGKIGVGIGAGLSLATALIYLSDALNSESRSQLQQLTLENSRLQSTHAVVQQSLLTAESKIQQLEKTAVKTTQTIDGLTISNAQLASQVRIQQQQQLSPEHQFTGQPRIRLAAAISPLPLSADPPQEQDTGLTQSTTTTVGALIASTN